MSLPEPDGVYQDDEGTLWRVSTFDAGDHDERRAIRLGPVGPYAEGIPSSRYAPVRLRSFADAQADAEADTDADDDTEVTPTDRVVYAHLAVIDAIRALPAGQTAQTGTTITLLSGATLTLGVQLEQPRPRRF